MIDNSSCSWTLSRCCIEMPFLVRATEFNPPTRSHRGLFNFQITHVGYGETWKEKGVVEAYSMKGNHPNYPLPGARLKTFTGLDNKYFIDSSSSNEIKNFRCRHTLRSAKISDGCRYMQIPICTSKQMFASVNTTNLAIATEKFSSLEFRVNSVNRFNVLQ